MPQNDLHNYGWILTPILAVALTISGWFMKVVWGRTNDNAKAFQKVSDSLGRHKLYLAEKYVPKDDFKDFGDRMDKRFDRIEELYRSDR